jgi:WD40 repeat protein/DNA-binding SARP family transcriptional activator
VGLTGGETTPTFTDMKIALLGPLVVLDGAGRLGSRDRRVLTALAIRPGAVLSPDQLADAIWSDNPPRSWHKNLQSCIVRLRKLLGVGTIETLHTGYRLTISTDEVDAQKFEQLIVRGRELFVLGEHERAAFVLGEALSLWRGQPLVELEGWDLADIEAGRLAELHLSAEELRLEALLRAGHHADMQADAQAMVQAAPLRERRWSLLALTQYQNGRQGEALKTIRDMRAQLLTQLGLDPSGDVVALEEAILRHDDTLFVDFSLPSEQGTCPYQGLMPYDVEDAESYFGRARDVASCMELVMNHGVLAVVGPSGIGKSSLVRAGIAAALRRDGRAVIVITPGPHPLRALPPDTKSSQPPVLIIDQCEEVFSLCADPEERSDFLAAVVRRAQSSQVVIALRADRLADVAAVPDFARLVERGLHLLGPMGEEGVRETIDLPARQCGLLVEPGLIDLLVREVQGEPGALPLLSHALMETWKRREGITLTVAAYGETGGIRGAVAQSAERVYAHVDADQRELLRHLMLRLVLPGPDGQPVRSRVRRRTLALDTQHEQLVDLLVASRLVTSDDGVVEIAHEALARAWPRLRAWLDDDIEGQRILHHLASAADSWDMLARPESELYRGVRLAKALDWRTRATPGLSPNEQAFLDASQQLSEAELHSAEDTARRQARNNQRLRALLAAAVALLLATGLAGLLATRATDRALRETVRADQERTAADARRLGARALVTDDIALSMLLALEGYRLDDSPESRANLIAALGRRPELLRSVSTGEGSAPGRLDVSPDGRTIALQDMGNRVTLFDARSMEVLASVQADGPQHLGNPAGPPLEFSPDGKQLAVGFHTFEGDPVQLLDGATLLPSGVQLGGLPEAPAQAMDVSFSPDGSRIAATFQEFRDGAASAHATSSYVLVWDLRDPQEPRFRADFAGAAWVLQHVAFSPDGRILYTSNPLTRYDAGTGRLLEELDPGFWLSFELNPAGTLAAMPEGFDPSIVLVNPATGHTVHRLQGHKEYVWGARFSPDGTLLASTSRDRSVIVWDVATGESLFQLQTDEETVVGFDFSEDSRLLYTAGLDGALRTWDITGNQALVTRLPVPPVTVGDPGFARLSPQGDTVAYVRRGYDDARTPTLQFEDVSTGRLTRRIDTRHRTFIGAGAWHPAGHLYATGGGDGVVRVWDREGNSPVLERRVADGMITEVDYSPDGTILVVSEQSGRVSMLDASTLAPTGNPVQFDEPTCCVTAGPDRGRVVVLTGGPSYLPQRVQPATGWALLDVESGETLRTGSLGIEGGLYADFSPDGRHVAVVGEKGMLVVIDVGTGLPLRPPTVAHDGSAKWVGYNADGTRMLSVGDGGMVALWDGATAEMVSSTAATGRLSGTGAAVGVAGAGFLPEDDRSVLLIGGSTGLYSWDTSVEAAVDAACDIAGRNLTLAEWREHLGDRTYDVTCPDYPPG